VLLEVADRAGLVLLAPSSRAATWDAIGGSYGSDVALIDRALEISFRSTGARPGRVAIAGFSDGASYALGLGLANGDLFSRVIAFSPGFVPSAPRVGRPAVFVSHGTGDAVLPIDRTSRRIVPALRDDGYDVTYEEFEGGHAIPGSVARAATSWLQDE
jgi:predicted esterase